MSERAHWMASLPPPGAKQVNLDRSLLAKTEEANAKIEIFVPTCIPSELTNRVLATTLFAIVIFALPEAWMQPFKNVVECRQFIESNPESLLE